MTIREAVTYLEGRLDEALLCKLAERLRELEENKMPARLELVVNVPPRGGMPVVEPDWDEKYQKKGVS